MLQTLEMHDRLQQQENCHDLMYQVAILNQAIEQEEKFERVIEVAIAGLCELLKADCVYLTSVMYLDRFPLQESDFLQEKIENNQSIRIDDIQIEDPNLSPDLAIFLHILQSSGIQSFLCIPFRSKQGNIGAIATFDSRPRTWEKEELSLRFILPTLAAAIDRSNLLANASSINHIIEEQANRLIAEQKRLAHQEKLASLGQLSAGLAHEINNPLSFISGNLKYVIDYARDILALIQWFRCIANPQDNLQDYLEEKGMDLDDLDFTIADFPKILDSMQLGCDRVRNIVDSLKSFSRQDDQCPVLCDINQEMENTLIILNNKLKQGITVERNYSNLPPVTGYGGQLSQVFLNILANAIDALEERDRDRTPEEKLKNPSQICIHTQQDGENAIVRILDNGSGIPEEKQSRIFEPFFTTKPAGKGTGLGLSLSYQIIVEKHNGQLECFSEAGQGTEFCISIPVEWSQNLMRSLECTI
ncbi:MAG: sensor histidine kinase [Spirulina sp.]